MKKSIFFLALLALVSIISSCGTSDTEKINYQSNAQKVLQESFGEESPNVAQMPVSPTIRLIDSVYIPALKKLDVKKCFSKDKNEAIANFYHWGNWSDWFYESAGMIEDLPGFTLRIYQTTQSTTDREILSQTGGNLLSESQLFQVWSYLFAKQPNGESGKLTNSRWNIFHTRKKDGAAVAAGASWDSSSDGWFLSAGGFDSWREGGLVFSRGN